ncbi:MAG: hypothetical protein WA947_15750 [Phormidesmis sp.]
MADPITTISAGVIVNLAFQEFLKSGAGELAKQFTTAAIEKMGALRKAIATRLRGKNAVAEQALMAAESGDEVALENLSTFVGAEMLSDPAFAGQLQAIAQEIQAGKLIDQSNMVQNNSDNATGFQVKNEGGENYTGNITIHKT